MKSLPSVSVVICTKNRIEHLKRCVETIVKQSYKPKEIIIIDDYAGGGQNIYESLQAAFKKIKYSFLDRTNNIKIIIIRNRKSYGVVYSRNTGIKLASSDVIAFIDDDGYADRNWLKNIAKNYKDKKVLGVGGPVVEIGRKIKTPEKRISKLAYIRKGKIVTNYRIKKYGDAKYLPKKCVPFLQGGNMSFRKDALMKINGGDVKYTGNFYREETDLSFSISKKGNIIFEPSALAYHNTAKNGGCREFINYDINKFFFYMYRNTTYFFFKHFGISKAFKYTVNSVKRQIKLVQNNKPGITRDFLLLKDKKKAIIWILFGVFIGFYCWYKNLDKLPEFHYSKPISVNCFNLIVAGGTIKFIQIESETHIMKRLMGL